MDEVPFRERPFSAFLSHAHVDKGIVEPLARWLRDVADVPIWYDADQVEAGAKLVRHLEEGIARSKSLIVVASRSSIASGWVEQEVDAAITEQARTRDYRIIPIRVDDCQMPRFLENMRWVDMPGGRLDVRSATDLLLTLDYDRVELDIGQPRDTYVSLSWREHEAGLPRHVCGLLRAGGLRLIGDCKDQMGYLGGDRVRSILGSCGGFVAILPHRGGGETSVYMLHEIELAQNAGLPCLVVAEKEVRLPAAVTCAIVKVAGEEVNDPREAAGQRALHQGIADFIEAWRAPKYPHYVFYATDVGHEHATLNHAIKRVIQRVTAMPCILGDDIREGNVQDTIVERITNAFLVIADISDARLNTCIEAGVARGAGATLYLIAQEPRSSDKIPFMFRDRQVWFYADEVAILGRIRRIVRPYRRRVIEFGSQVPSHRQ